MNEEGWGNLGQDLDGPRELEECDRGCTLILGQIWMKRKRMFDEEG